jgi:hypothetical protein
MAPVAEDSLKFHVRTQTQEHDFSFDSQSGLMYQHSGARSNPKDVDKTQSYSQWLHKDYIRPTIRVRHYSGSNPRHRKVHEHQVAVSVFCRMLYFCLNLSRNLLNEQSGYLKLLTKI